MGDSSFAYKMLIFALVVAIGMSMMISVFVPEVNSDIDQDAIMEDYYKFTGQSKATKEAVWTLTGIYTPYEGGTYGYTDDGWLYGTRVDTNTPSQYLNSPFQFTVYRDDYGLYRYLYDSADYDESTGTGHKGHIFLATEDSEGYDSTATHPTETNYAAGEYVTRSYLGDYYTSVVFDTEYKSDIFFMQEAKYSQDGSKYSGTGNFYYNYTGFRYAFQPTENTVMVDNDGNTIDVTRTTTSLSLIWYTYYTSSGIAGQLVLSGNDSGVAYIESDQIVRAFSSTTSTARFDMTFNNVDMGIYIKIDPYQLANGMTVKDCYDYGYWSIMVTSKTTDVSAYTSTGYNFNPMEIFTTLIDLMTFDYSAYAMSAMMGTLCSLAIVIPLYAGLLAMATGSWQMLLFTVIVAAVNAVAALVKNVNNWFGGSDALASTLIDPTIIQDAIAQTISMILSSGFIPI